MAWVASGCRWRPNYIQQKLTIGIMTEFLFQLEWHVLFIGTLLAILFQRSILITEIAISIDRKPISVAHFCNTTCSWWYSRKLFQGTVDNLCQLPPFLFLRWRPSDATGSMSRRQSEGFLLSNGGSIFFARCYQAFPFQDEWGQGWGISSTPPTSSPVLSC